MPDTPARASSCTLPDTPADLVLRAERTVIPIGGDPSREGAEVTARGTCAAGIECVKVTDAELAEAYRLFQTATGVRHADTRMSPHYGSRTLTARWGTSECSVGDGQQSPVEKADWDTYYAAFDAIIGLAVHGRPDGGVGP